MNNEVGEAFRGSGLTWYSNAEWMRDASNEGRLIPRYRQTNYGPRRSQYDGILLVDSNGFVTEAKPGAVIQTLRRHLDSHGQTPEGVKQAIGEAVAAARTIDTVNMQEQRMQG